jgi:hypothetical protein
MFPLKKQLVRLAALFTAPPRRAPADVATGEYRNEQLTNTPPPETAPPSLDDPVALLLTNVQPTSEVEFDAPTAPPLPRLEFDVNVHDRSVTLAALATAPPEPVCAVFCVNVHPVKVDDGDAYTAPPLPPALLVVNEHPVYVPGSR